MLHVRHEAIRDRTLGIYPGTRGSLLSARTNQADILNADVEKVLETVTLGPSFLVIGGNDFCVLHPYLDSSLGDLNVLGPCVLF